VTTDLDPTIVRLLEVHVPEQDSTRASWADVVRRAERPSRMTRLRGLIARHPKSAISIVAVAAAVGCAGAVAHQRIYQLFGGGRSPVGTDVFQRLQSEYRWPHGLHVLVKQSRVVFSVRQPSATGKDGTPTAWATRYGVVAPRSDGGICLAEEGDWACFGAATPKIAFLPVLPTAWMDSAHHLHIDPFVFWGAAPKGTASVHLVLRSGREIPLPLSRVRLTSRVVFAIHMPTRLLTGGHRPIAVVARDRSGALLGSFKNLQYYLFPWSSNGGLPKPPPAPGASKPAHAAKSVPASGWLLKLHVAGVLHRFALGGQCLTDAYTTWGYQCQLATSFTPSVVSIRDRAGIAWGELPTGATHVTVVFAHRTEQAIVYINQYIFPVTTAELRTADLPMAVVATDAHGKVIERRKLPRTIFPGYG
jgi:hypothetical protein